MHLPDQDGFDGTYTQVTSTDAFNPGAGNYSVHQGLTASDATISWTPLNSVGANREGWVTGIQVVEVGKSAPLSLTVENSGSDLDFTWNGIAGKVYDLLSPTDLDTPISTWAVWDGNETMVGNTLTIPRPVDDTRFFAIIEKDVPPLISSDFEDDNGGFTNALATGTTDWEWGAPNSFGFGGQSVTEGAGGSAKCWGTNLTDDYAPTTDVALRSPVFDLAGVTGALLTFAEALDLDPGALAEVNIIKPTTDEIIETIHTSIEGDDLDSGWAGVGPIVIPDTIEEPVRLEFRLKEANTPGYMGWYVDDVVITSD
jgi:hypothetical protein